MEYVSPFDERAAEPVALAQRPAELAGRTVALLDITKNRGAEFLDRIEQLLRERGAETFRISKATFSRAAAAEVIEEIAIRGDLAVEGLAD
jgi:alpha-galactosidase/6-phospho-beta-glucosidase family protein